MEFSRALVNIMGEYFANETVQSCGNETGNQNGFKNPVFFTVLHVECHVDVREG